MSTIKIKRGTSVNTPILEDGELAYEKDTNSLVIGTESGNVKINSPQPIKYKSIVRFNNSRTPIQIYGDAPSFSLEKTSSTVFSAKTVEGSIYDLVAYISSNPATGSYCTLRVYGMNLATANPNFLIMSVSFDGLTGGGSFEVDCSSYSAWQLLVRERA